VLPSPASGISVTNVRPMLWAFIPIAALLSVTPGAATAMVIRSSMRGGWRAGVATILGNEVGVIAWALLSIAGISALVAASEIAFVALKIVGAAVLLWMGIQSWRGGHAAVISRGGTHPFRDGVVTSLANPKLAIFFVALFPQFVSPGAPLLGRTLLMAGLIAVIDLVWYTALSVMAARAKDGFMRSRAGRWLERVMGSVLIALGARVALETR
jgi:threonine/homoserine/homoserine lactone efflux protein